MLNFFDKLYFLFREAPAKIHFAIVETAALEGDYDKYFFHT